MVLVENVSKNASATDFGWQGAAFGGVPATSADHLDQGVQPAIQERSSSWRPYEKAKEHAPLPMM